MSGDLSLLRPLWLLALPVLVALAVLLRRRRAGLGDWERVLDPALLAAMQALGRIDATSAARRGGAGLCLAAVVVVALAGPAVERRDAAAYRNLDGVVFVLDASPSMFGAADWPSLQAAGRFGLAALGSRPGGLVVFAGDSYVVSEMTGDLRQLGQTWSLIDADTVPDPGSRPERGLAMARQMLDDAQVLAGDVVLFTDGGGLGPAVVTEAAAIAARGARLSLVGPGLGPEAQVLAQTGQGAVYDVDETDALAAFLAQDARDRLERQDYPLLFRWDLGRWLLLAALVPALVLFRRRGPA